MLPSLVLFLRNLKHIQVIVRPLYNFYNISSIIRTMIHNLLFYMWSGFLSNFPLTLSSSKDEHTAEELGFRLKVMAME